MASFNKSKAKQWFLEKRSGSTGYFLHSYPSRKPYHIYNADSTSFLETGEVQKAIASSTGVTWFIQSGKSWKKVSFSTRVWKVLESHGKSWNNFLGSLKVMESHGIFSLLFIFICLHMYFKVQKKINSRKLYVLNLNNLWYKNLF